MWSREALKWVLLVKGPQIAIAMYSVKLLGWWLQGVAQVKQDGDGRVKRLGWCVRPEGFPLSI